MDVQLLHMGQAILIHCITRLKHLQTSRTFTDIQLSCRYRPGVTSTFQHILVCYRQ